MLTLHLDPLLSVSLQHKLLGSVSIIEQPSLDSFLQKVSVIVGLADHWIESTYDLVSTVEKNNLHMGVYIENIRYSLMCLGCQYNSDCVR